MKNTECIICGDEVVNPLQKQQGKRVYCSEKCEYIPSVFQRWDEFQVWLISSLIALDLSRNEVRIKITPFPILIIFSFLGIIYLLITSWIWYFFQKSSLNVILSEHSYVCPHNWNCYILRCPFDSINLRKG